MVLRRLAHRAKGAIPVGVSWLTTVVACLGWAVLPHVALFTACLALDIDSALRPCVLVTAAGRADLATGDAYRARVI